MATIKIKPAAADGPSRCFLQTSPHGNFRPGVCRLESPYHVSLIVFMGMRIEGENS